MKITHYLYNAFIIESGNRKLAIDPGALFFYFFRFSPLIPKSEWHDITHLFITHGDPDHYWHADRVAKASGATIVCNATMVRESNSQQLMLGPRARGLAFTIPMENLRTLSPGDTLLLDGMSVTGIRTVHGSLLLKLGPFSRTVTPGPGERIGWGAIGFDIRLDGKRIVNLGDTLLLKDDWFSIDQPDVLMLPIGGRTIHNTMDAEEALEAVRLMQPKLVIPCHYNCPAFFTRRYNPADEDAFKRAVEATGSRCRVLHSGESVDIA